MDPAPDTQVHPCVIHGLFDGITFGDLSDLYVLLALNPKARTAPLRGVILSALEHEFGRSLTLEDVMSMFDQEPNFEEAFKEGDRFVLTAARFVGEVNTRHGKARKSLFTICTRESYPGQETYSALGAGFANMAERATPADFPVLVEYVRLNLPNGNTLKRFAPIPNGEPGKFVKGEEYPPLTDAEKGIREGTGSDAPAGSAGTVSF